MCKQNGLEEMLSYGKPSSTTRSSATFQQSTLWSGGNLQNTRTLCMVPAYSRITEERNTTALSLCPEAECASAQPVVCVCLSLNWTHTVVLEKDKQQALWFCLPTEGSAPAFLLLSSRGLICFQRWKLHLFCIDFFHFRQQFVASKLWLFWLSRLMPSVRSSYSGAFLPSLLALQTFD